MFERLAFRDPFIDMHGRRMTRGHTVRAHGRLTRVTEKLETLLDMPLAEQRLVYGHAAVNTQRRSATATSSAACVTGGRGAIRRRLLARFEQILGVGVADLVEFDHFVILEAAHVLMRRHTVGT